MKRYHVTTFGCQMNAHDSERIKGLLEELGLGEAPSQAEADVMVFNTCTIREKPDQRFAAHLAQARALKARDPERVIAVGGCYAEAQRERLFELFPFVDVAFGPGSIPHLAEWLGAGGEAPRGRFAEWRHFAGDLPAHRERRYQAWVQVSMGCNSVCSYCIVPSVRGREQSRRPGDIVAEVERLAAEGVREVTLLGQNVNPGGETWRLRCGRSSASCSGPSTPLTESSGSASRARIRRTSASRSSARWPSAPPSVSTRTCRRSPARLAVLKAMRRTYTRERYLALASRLREAVPDLALTTDLIVGFPGETEAEFEETVSLVEEIRFDGAYTFVFSPRRGTEAATMHDQVSEDVKRERIERLIEVVQAVAADQNRRRIGRTEEVLVEGASRTDASLLRGRTRRNLTVNFSGSAQAGELVDVRIDGATSTTLSGHQATLATVP